MSVWLNVHLYSGHMSYGPAHLSPRQLCILYPPHRRPPVLVLRTTWCDNHPWHAIMCFS